STGSPGERPGAAAVPHGASVAVLMIDMAQRQVVYANATAIELAGGTVRLPVGVREWSEAAGLTDPEQRPFPEGASPLSRIASGESVTGEPVALHADSDSYRSGGVLAGAGTFVRVTGFALTDPQCRAGADGSQALAVMLPSADSVEDERRMGFMRDRAVLATEMSFTISDPRREDDPLAWVNPSFVRLTGYSLQEAVGRNCRFLQGPNTDRSSVRRMRDALEDRRPITEVLLNYRRDGTAFWNQVSISPVHDDDGELVNFVGVQSDVTERVVVEQERRAALADAEAARAQLRLLAEATTAMTAALDTADACTRLARIIVPELADLCTVDLLDAPGGHTRQRMAVATREADDEPVLSRFGALGGSLIDRQAAHAVRAGRPYLIPDLPESGAEQYPGDPDAGEVYEQLRLRSAIVVPLRGRGRVLGTVTLYTQFPYGRRYGQRDVHLVTDLAGRAGLAVDNARLYEVERAAASTLQHSLLPAVPEVPGLQIAARYLVGADGNQVGGDWYDVLPLPGGSVGAAVGDVVGHDLSAAAAMGQLRGVLRSYAWGGDRPGPVLDRCDQLVQGLDIAAMATAVYARLEPAGADGTRILRYSNAGHPPPLLRRPDGELVRLDGHSSPMLGAVPEFGVASGPRREEATVTCEPGSLLVFYTDGLTDIIGEDADERTLLIEQTVAGLPRDADPETVVERTLEVCLPDQLGDDIALLAIRLMG
ncbi:GAF domain-containing SpoIIE family protein phosphatase, partial [Pseudonocardia sp. KRD291]|uniref:GAF domain-containing SpoIIE family protein phosphatase n=1 Tax=Pseudonocardia sp. KRD291 TaxID=2792007 RepID=UPI001C49EC3A